MTYDSVQKFNSVENYILQMRPILRKRALFSDGTADYRMPPEPKAGDTVKIRFRTAADNVDLVVLCHEDEHIEMYLTDCDRDFDYYEAEIRVGEEQYKYHFEIISGMLRCTYDRAGVSRDFRPQYEFCIIPGFSTPKWAKGAVMYQIFTDRFCNGDTSNDVKTGEYYYINRQTKQVENWDKCPEDFDVANFYGGDLAGVLSKMDYLEELGVEVIVKENASVREEDQLRAIDELVKEGIQGLALMPVDTEGVREKLNWLVNEKKIPVVTFNSDIVGTKRCCFVGMDNKLSGQTAAGLFGMMTRGVGKILVITGYFSSMLNNSRVDGFVEEIKNISPKLEIAGVQGSFNNADEVEHIIENAMMSISGINGIFVVSGGQEGIVEAFRKLGVEQRPYVVIYDQTAKNETLLKEGTADFLIDQNGFEQGYRPPRILADILLNGTYPDTEYLYTGIDIKTKYNL